MFLDIFSKKMYKYHIPRKSLRCEWRCSIQTDMVKRTIAFSNIANASKNAIELMASYLF